MTPPTMSAARRVRNVLRRVRASAPMRVLVALPDAARFLAAPARDGWLFDVAGSMGMGGMMTHAVSILHHAEQSGVAARLRFTNPLYAREQGHDWFGDFFVQSGAPPVDAQLHRIAVRNHWDYQLMLRGNGPTLAEARAIFQEKLGFSTEADAFLEAARASLPPLAQSIGVHYRGTDKAFEARSASQEAVFHAIRQARAVTGYDTLFLATDEDKFAQELERAFPDMIIVTWQHAVVKRIPGVPVHFSAGDGHAKGIEAVTLIRLLAETGLLVRTASYLSGWSQVLRPDLPTFFVNPFSLYDPMFPDRELLYAASFAATG